MSVKQLLPNFNFDYRFNVFESFKSKHIQYSFKWKTKDVAKAYILRIFIKIVLNFFPLTISYTYAHA